VAILGFSFTAKDDGLGKQLQGFRDDFKSLGKEILSLQRFQTFLSALSFEKLDALNDKMHSITTSGMNLTSSLDARFQQMDISSRKMGVGLGKSFKDIQKFSKANTQLSMALGISAEEAGKANAAFDYLDKTSGSFNETVADAFKDLGLSTAKDVAKFADAMQIDPYEFTYGLTQMQKQLGLTKEGVTGILGSLQQYGAETGDVAGAIKKMAGLQEHLAKAQSVFKLDAKGVQTYAQGITSLGLAFQRGGVADGFAMSQELSEKIVQAGGDFSKMISGVGNLPDMITKLGVTGLNTDKIFASMQQGPAAFAGEIAKMAEAARAQGKDIGPAMTFIKNQLSDTLGEGFITELTRIAGNDKVRKTFLTALDPKAIEAGAANGVKALGEVKKAFRDSRTTAELFDQQVELFENRFRGLGKRTDAQFLKDSQKGFNDFGNVLAHVSKEGGPMGTLVQKMAEVQKFGATALLPPDMAAQVTAFGSAAEKLAGPLAKLKSLGLLSPLGALAAIVAVLGSRFISLYSQTKDAGKALELLGLEVLNFVKVTLPNKIKAGVKFVADAARRLLVGGFGLGAQGARNAGIGMEIVKAIFDGIKSAWNFVIEGMKGLWAGLTGGMIDPSNDAQAIGGALGMMLRKAFDVAKTFIVGYLRQWWANMTAIATDPSKTLGQKIGEGIKESLPLAIGGGLIALSPIGGVLAKSFKLVLDVVLLLYRVFGGFIRFLPTLWSGLSTLWTVLETVWTIFEAIVGAVTGTTGAIATLLAVVVALTIGFLYFPNATQAAVDAVAAFAKGLGKYIGIALTYIAEIALAIAFLPLTLLYFGADIISGLFDLMGSLIGWVGKLGPALASAINGLLKIVENLIVGALLGIRDTLAQQFPTLAGPIIAIFDAIIAVYQTMMGVIRGGVAVIGEVIATVGYFFERLFGTLSLLAQVIWKYLTDALSAAVGFVTGAFSSVGTFFTDLWASIYAAGQPFFDWIAGAFRWLYDNVIKPIGSAISQFYDMMVTNLSDTIQTMKDAFGSLRNLIGGLFDNIDAKLRSILGRPAAPAAPATPAATPAPAAPAAVAPVVAAAAPTAATPAAAMPTMPAPARPAGRGGRRGAAMPTPVALPAAAMPTAGGAGGGPGAAVAPFTLALPGAAGAAPVAGAGAGPAVGPGRLLGGAPLTPPAGLTGAPSPALPAGGDITALVDATNNPAWVRPLGSMLETMHSETLAALRAIGGGGRAPGSPAPIGRTGAAIPSAPGP
jgi:hypothetical protein